VAEACPAGADVIAKADAPALPEELWAVAAAGAGGTVAVWAVVAAGCAAATAAVGAITGTAESVPLADGEELVWAVARRSIGRPRVTSDCGAPEFGDSLVACALACRPVPVPRPETASAALAAGTAAVAGVEAFADAREGPCAGLLEPLDGDPELLADPLAPPEPPVSAAASPGIANIAAPMPRAAASAPIRPTAILVAVSSRPLGSVTSAPLPACTPMAHPSSAN
jgi:hypothetical protein